jgi:hypothetical protein
LSELLTPTGFSADANWFWDGRQWNDAVSPDGKWRFNGKEWKRFKRKRTPMPAEPLYRPPAAPPSPVPSIEMPSWVAPSEVERIVKEKQEQALWVATPQMPPPPERDWRRAGEYIEHSRTVRAYRDWQVGGASVAYFIIIYFTCAPIAWVFIWRTAWRLPTKVLVTVGAILGPVVVYFLSVGTGLLPGIDYRR